MTTFSSRLSKTLVAVISKMKNSLEWTDQKVWFGIWVASLGFFLSVCCFGFLQSFANLSSWDAASSTVWILDLYSTAKRKPKHHLLPWVSGRNDLLSFCSQLLEQSPCAVGVPHTPLPLRCTVTAQLALFCQLLSGKCHGPVMQSTVPLYPTTTGLSLFTILEEKIWGEDLILVWIGAGWLLHSVFKGLHPYCLSFNSPSEAGPGSHHVLYLIWWEQSHAHSVFCIRFVRLSHLVSILVERRLHGCKPSRAPAAPAPVLLLIYHSSAAAHGPTHPTPLLGLRNVFSQTHVPPCPGSDTDFIQIPHRYLEMISEPLALCCCHCIPSPSGSPCLSLPSHMVPPQPLGKRTENTVSYRATSFSFQLKACPGH